MADQPKALDTRERLFLDAYFDMDARCPMGRRTYLNLAASARAAGITETPYLVFKRLAPHITAWLNEIGLSEAALKTRVMGLLDKKETKLVTLKCDVDGIDADDLPEGVRIVARTKGAVKTKDNGSQVTGEDTVLLAVEVDSLDNERKTLEFASKLQGLYKEKLEVLGLSELGKRLTAAQARVGGDAVGDASGKAAEGVDGSDDNSWL